MNIKTDYEDQILGFLKRNFEPVENEFKKDKDTLELSLKEIHKKVISVLPSDYIYESDIYECLKTLGFQAFLITVPEKTIGDDIIPAREKFCYLLRKKTAAI